MKETLLETNYSSTTVSHTMDAVHPSTHATLPDTEKSPLPTGKNNGVNRDVAQNIGRAGSEPIDARALSEALKSVEERKAIRERTPISSPSRKRQRIYGDRSVPFQIITYHFERLAKFPISPYYVNGAAPIEETSDAFVLGFQETPSSGYHIVCMI